MAALAEEGQRSLSATDGADQQTSPSLENAWYYGGKLPKETKPSSDSGSWWRLQDGSFNVRSPTYLDDGVKQPSAPSVFKVLCVCSVDASRPLLDVGRRLKPLSELLASATHAKSEFVITNRAIPMGTYVRNVIVVSVREVGEGKDAAFDRAWKRFKEGDNQYRDLRLKYLPRLSVAPWLLTKAIDVLGGQRPVIMGKGYLAQSHFTGDNYIEVDVDISSSAVARSVASSCLTYCTGLVIDEAFVVECKQEDELPERILTQIRYHNVDIDKFTRALREGDYNADGLPGWEDVKDEATAGAVAGSGAGGSAVDSAGAQSRERVGSEDLGDFDEVDEDED